jgi:hypothetical protein
MHTQMYVSDVGRATSGLAEAKRAASCTRVVFCKNDARVVLRVAYCVASVVAVTVLRVRVYACTWTCERCIGCRGAGR